MTFLISNGTIQSAVSSWALGSALRIHPVVVLLATLIGGTLAGLIGMVLAAPLVAAAIRSAEVIRAGRASDPDPADERRQEERERPEEQAAAHGAADAHP
ncbi:AI-2E family transporter [Tessaracoccus sp. HDW20]|uniref:AI-2E family transporter n=1 Tax=Tessaracoccus coleopterorum TaxID=2714950 RepID=UPI0018D3BF85|nr:AI-2E family transporter [Tessaracoccus coleopterorum]NHB84845.1 AI-2E family transporter [Tessaracoccus coleopterorum]